MRNTNIAITHLSYLSADGSGLEAFYNQINNGTQEKVIENFDPEGFLGRKGLRYLGNSSKMYGNLAFKCLEHPNVKVFLNAHPDRFGLYDGSELANLEEAIKFDFVAKADGPDYVSPMKSPNTLANASASFTAIKTGITGPNFSVCGGATGFMQAMDIACMHLRNRIVDYGIVIATEPDSKYHDAIRVGENKSDKKIAPPHGVGFRTTMPELAEWNKEKTYGRISKILSGQKLKVESNAELVVRLIENVFDDRHRPRDIDGIILTGMHNLEMEEFINELWWSLEIEHARVYLPEVDLGICESTGGGIGIMYANGLATGAIQSKQNMKNQNFLICSIDQLGYGTVSLLRI